MQANTHALQTATAAASFNTMDELNQGASTLLSIVTTITKNDVTGKTFDMAGRESAVDFMTVRSRFKAKRLHGGLEFNHPHMLQL